MKQNNDWLLAKAVLLKQRSNMWLPMAVPPNGNTESGLYRFVDDVVVPIPAALAGNAAGIADLVVHARSRDTTPERGLEQGRQE